MGLFFHYVCNMMLAIFIASLCMFGECSDVAVCGLPGGRQSDTGFEYKIKLRLFFVLLLVWLAIIPSLSGVS